MFVKNIIICNILQLSVFSEMTESRGFKFCKSLLDFI